MIKSLNLYNFKRHEALELVFAPGVNVICGPNYAGKSTVMHGVLMALFGVSAVPGGAAMAWRRGSDKQTAKVELEMSVSGVDISITRTRSSASLRENGEETAKGTSPVNKRVQELLGMSKADFLMIKYAAQKETAALLSFNAQGLRGLIERVSGSALIQAVLSDVGNIATEYTGALKALQPVNTAELQEALTAAQADMKALLVAKTDAAQNVQTAAAEIKQIVAQLHEDQKHNERMRELALRRDELKVTLSGISAGLSTCGQQLEALSGYEQAELDALRTQLQWWRDNNRRIDDNATRSEELVTKLADLAKAVGAARSKVEALRGDIDHTKTVVAGLAGSVAEAAQLRDDLAGRRERLRAVKAGLQAAVCPTCKRPFDEAYDREAEAVKAATLEVEISELDQKLAVVQTRVDDHASMTKRLVALEASLKHLTDSTIPELEAEVGHNQGLVQEADECLRTLGEKTDASTIAKAEEAVAAYDAKLRERIRMEEKVHGLTERHLAVGAELAKYEGQVFAHRETATLDRQLREWQDVVVEAEQQQEDARQRHAEVSSRVRTLSTSLEAGTVTNARIAEYEKLQARAVSLQEFLKKNREAFMASVWQQFLDLASSFSANVTGGSLSAVTRDGDDFVYVENGEVMALSGASGAQQAIIGLGMKTALATAIPDSLNCLLLDEVTADMDEVRASTTTALLGTLSRQVIAVSHREYDRSGSYNVIHLQ